MKNTKQWWTSRTLWVNVLTLLAMVITQIMGWSDMQAYAPELLMISNVVNILLRFVSTAQLK